MAPVFYRGVVAVNKETPPRVPDVMKSRSESSHHCATCEIRDGIPRTNGWGYYASHDGTRMLVMERRPDQRIRINGTVEIVVLEADNERVRLGIDGTPGLDARAAD